MPVDVTDDEMPAGGGSRALVGRCLAGIDRHNDVLRAVLTPLHDEALEAAARADEAQERGDWLGVLHGMPVSVKDHFATAGVRTTMGSDLFRDHVPEADSEVVRRLRAAGAVIVAKDNLHEFASGQTSDNPHFGSCRNPWDPARVPGGSSGGSAAAVAAGMTIGAVGTDAGGSVRAPAALCGIVGLRPTVGRISGWNDGLADIAEFSVPGPLARRATDVARLFAALDGFDRRDPLAARGPSEDILGPLFAGIDGLRVGLATGPFFEAVDEDVASAVREATDVLETLGASVHDLDLPDVDECATHFHSIRWAQGAAILESALENEPHRLGADVRDSLLAGREVTGVDYAKAVAWRQRWLRTVEALFEDVDVIVSPTTPLTAPHATAPPWWLPTQGTLLRPWAMAGVPSISLPCGFDRIGLPIGMEVAAAHWEDALLLRLGVAYQSTTDWHRRLPPGFEDPATSGEG